MGLLSDGARKALQTGWEEGRRSLPGPALPQGPDGRAFAALPTTVPPCTPGALVALLGPQVTEALAAQARSADVGASLQEQLLAHRTALEAHLDLLTGELERAQATLLGRQAALAAAETAVATLGQVRATLGQPAGDALPASVLAQVRAACPAMGAFLDHTEAAIDTASTSLTQAAQAYVAATDLVASLQAARAATQDQLTRTADQLTALPALLAQIGGAP